MSKSSLFSRTVLAAVIVTAVGVGIVVVRPRKAGPPVDRGASGEMGTVGATNLPPGAASSEFLTAGQERLKRGLSRDEAKGAMAELSTRLRSLPATEASAALQAQLRSGADISTGLDFKPRSDGSLAEAPTWRVFLLDELARVDPAAAAALAREILREANSPDEWAVALRNLARGDDTPESRALLEAKVGDLLRNEAWQVNPSAGYLEAFDVAVFTGGTNLVAPLTALVRRHDNPAVTHAAYLALDRMTMTDPVSLLTKLTEEPELMQGREVTRANYLARADASDPAQRAIVERYLLDPRRTAEELRTFVGLFPNANFMISQNLLTRSATPGHAALVARDVAALQTLDEWLADPRFARVRDELAQSRERLAQFVKQAQRQ